MSASEKILACAPNISEGEDVKKIRMILNPVEKSKGVRLLLAHSFKSYNRTEAFFIGEAEETKRVSIEVVKRASELLDMQKHSGDHPRIGAIDTLPFIPVKGYSIEECVDIAHEAGRTIAGEMKIPVFYYARAAKREEYRELSNLRDEEYEGLKKLFDSGELRPDDGPMKFNFKSGAIAIGARPHVTYLKITINTNNAAIADQVARAIRESGEEKTNGSHVSGRLQEVRAMAFKTSRAARASILIALTDGAITPLHTAFLEVKRQLENLNYDIESTEIQGFVLKRDLVAAGEHFNLLRNRSVTKEKDIIRSALEEMKTLEVNQKKRILDA